MPGRTVLLVDVSGSMDAPLAPVGNAPHRCGLRARHSASRDCEKVIIYSFSNELAGVPARRGFALRDAIDASQPHSGTYLGRALGEIREKYDRIIVITDEQSHDRVPAPRGRGYVINVASNKNGVGYGPWTHIDGWSEAIIEYIRSHEQVDS